ncbi:MAG: response regulator [Chlorobi bacterium]|nr:response regulator [Chlorobiota bacterium]
MNKRILIVEDEALWYHNLKELLERDGYEVDEFTKSVKEAEERIRRHKPDLVLVDIHLDGNESGLELGKRLKEQWDIPFIYLTAARDEATFVRAVPTEMEDYVIKGTDEKDEKDLLHRISLALWRRGKQRAKSDPRSNGRPKFAGDKVGMTAFTDYLNALRVSGANQVTEVPVRFDDIAFFTTDTEKLSKKLQPRSNYFFMVDKDNNVYYLPGHLSNLCRKLPLHFVRIGDGYVVNILTPTFEGRINGKTLKILGKDFKISNTYRRLFNERMKMFYLDGREAGK